MDNETCKKCRREGVKLFLKGEKCFSPKCPFVRRSYAPGQHGLRSKKLSDFAKQLREKQKAKRIYGIRETQFKNYYQKAAQHSGDTGEMLLSFLERRLDNIIYRLGLVSSRKTARQLVSHGHFLVNKKKVTVPSYIVSVKEKIEVKPKSKTGLEAEKGVTLPSWLKVEEDKMSGYVKHLPQKEEMEASIDIAQIIEFYSR